MRLRYKTLILFGLFKPSWSCNLSKSFHKEIRSTSLSRKRQKDVQTIFKNIARALPVQVTSGFSIQSKHVGKTKLYLMSLHHCNAKSRVASFQCEAASLRWKSTPRKQPQSRKSLFWEEENSPAYWSHSACRRDTEYTCNLNLEQWLTVAKGCKRYVHLFV